VLAGGAALGVVGGFLIATSWQEPVSMPAGPAIPAPVSRPHPDVVKALDVQTQRILKLEAEVERLSQTVRELSRALRAATDADGAGAAPTGPTLPWLPLGALEVAKAWYAERIAGSIQALAAKAAGDATDDQKRAWAAQAKREADQLQTLRKVITETQFAQWLQSTGHGERVPTRDELAATAAKLKQG